jgi:hypothetical protein
MEYSVRNRAQEQLFRVNNHVRNNTDEALFREIPSGKTIETLSSKELWQIVERAIHMGYVSWIRSLISHGVDLNRLDKTHESPLYLVVIELSISHGRELRAAMSNLEHIECSNRLAIMKLLLAHGANTRHVYRERGEKWDDPYRTYTIMDVVTEKGSYEMVKIMLRNGVDISETPTHFLPNPREQESDLRIGKLMRRMSTEATNMRIAKERALQDVFASDRFRQIEPETTQFISRYAGRVASSLDLDIEPIIASFDALDYRCKWRKST